MPGTSAPLSKPIIRNKPLKRSSTPSMSQSHSRTTNKRPRPSNSSTNSNNNDYEHPLKKKESYHESNGTNLGGEGSSMRKGMYLAFIDDAFNKKNEVRRAF